MGTWRLPNYLDSLQQQIWRALGSACCMQGVVHVIDAVLQPPPDALARAAVHQALQDFGVKGSMTPTRHVPKA